MSSSCLVQENEEKEGWRGKGRLVRERRGKEIGNKEPVRAEQKREKEKRGTFSNM
jgi:hypothetical protein